VVIGASKPSDFDEALGVLQRFNLADPATVQMVRDAAARIRAALDRACGEVSAPTSTPSSCSPLPFADRCLDPSCATQGGLAGLYQGLPDHTDPVCNGIAIAHMVWLWALVKGLGLYSYAKERFDSLEGCAKTWKKEKSVEENILAWNGFNTGRSLMSQTDVIPAEALAKVRTCAPCGRHRVSLSCASTSLSVTAVSPPLRRHHGQCPDPERIRKIVAELHSWYAADGDAKPTPQQLTERGWAAAYSLRTWPDFPGLTVNITGVLLQRLTGGLMGIGGGPTKDAAYVEEVKRTRTYWNSVVTA